MKTVDTILRNAIRQSHNLYAKPRLTVEWNMNRYSDVSADNILPEQDFGNDPEMFPIESIYEANRPTKGIVKARVAEATIASNDPAGRNTRYYVADIEDRYKYWTSPEKTNSSGNFATHTDGDSVVRPYILYSTPVKANRITVKTESTWATPKNYEIRIRTTVGGAWTKVGPSNPTINTSTGQIDLYYDGAAWTSTPTSWNGTLPEIAGIMFKVGGLQGGTDLVGQPSRYRINGATSITNGANAYFSLIEIAAIRQHDLTNKLIGVSDTFDMSEKSILYPIGTVTANTASISLENYTGDFNKENVLSPYAGLMEENALFTLDYVYTVNGVDYPVRQFSMYCGPWSGTKSDQVSLELRDFTKFFDAEKPTTVMYQGRSASEIIWRLCDTIGFNKYQVDVDDTVGGVIIPWFWADGQKTMFELLDEISKATQTAIWFDAFGVLQIRNRESAFNTNRAVDWTLRGVASGNELPDIISLEQTDIAQTNHVTVTYYTTDIERNASGGTDKKKIVWQPEGDLVLRATKLTHTLNLTDPYVKIPPVDAKIWPWSGIVQIQGELIRYEGKRFRYIENNITKYATVKSQDDFNLYNNKVAADQQYRNGYTGELVITERGLWNSEENTHAVEASGYSIRKIVDANYRTGAAGFTHLKSESCVRLQAGPNMTTTGDILFASRGNEGDTGFHYFGTRMKLNPSGDNQAGLFFNNGNGSDENGYFIELKETAKVNREDRNELLVFKRKNGSTTRINGKGKQMSVVRNVWYDIDVIFEANGGTHVITVYVNGVRKSKTSFTDTIPLTGKFGMFTRGQTDATYEYLYAIKKEQGEVFDDTSFYDYIEGGYTGSKWDTEWVFKWKTVKRRVKKRIRQVQIRWNNRFMDEFGPWVHEVREFDVKFDPFPVLHSDILNTNKRAVVTEYNGGSFGAKFVMANIARRNVVVNGEDALGSAVGEGDNKSLLIFGRVVNVSDPATVIVKNEDQIRRDGRIETSIDSKWIQSESAAKAIANWIDSHWSIGADEIVVTVFGNPLIEVGDMVAVDFPEKSMLAGTHQYFVLSVQTDFAQGLETTLTLRRKV